jgi:hypothetical protein
MSLSTGGCRYPESTATLATAADVLQDTQQASTGKDSRRYSLLERHGEITTMVVPTFAANWYAARSTQVEAGSMFLENSQVVTMGTVITIMRHQSRCEVLHLGLLRSSVVFLKPKAWRLDGALMEMDLPLPRSL